MQTTTGLEAIVVIVPTLMASSRVTWVTGPTPGSVMVVTYWKLVPAGTVATGVVRTFKPPETANAGRAKRVEIRLASIMTDMIRKMGRPSDTLCRPLVTRLVARKVRSLQSHDGVPRGTTVNQTLLRTHRQVRAGTFALSARNPD